jgi:hypothetical protein
VEGIYGMNVQFASLEPPPAEIQALLGALQGRQDDINSFIGTISGAVSVESFYAPQNVERILGAYTERAMGAH